MAERLATNLWRLDIPLEGNPLKNLNSYLITGEERSLLIDTGFRQDSCRRALTDQLAEGPDGPAGGDGGGPGDPGYFPHPSPQRPHRSGP